MMRKHGIIIILLWMGMMKQINVLVADNSDEFTGLFSKYISINPNINIVGIAHDGQEAIDLIKETNPNVLLLDLVMPRIDGFEVLRRISAEEKGLLYLSFPLSEIKR